MLSKQVRRKLHTDFSLRAGGGSFVTLVCRYSWPEESLGNTVSAGVTVCLEERTAGHSHGDVTVIVSRWLGEKKVALLLSLVQCQLN